MLRPRGPDEQSQMSLLRHVDKQTSRSWLHGEQPGATDMHLPVQQVYNSDDLSLQYAPYLLLCSCS